MQKRTKKNTAVVASADLSPASNGGRIAQVLLNVDLRNSHDGLMEIAKKRGITAEDLKPGQYLVFVNDNKDRFKIFAMAPSGRGAIVAYYKSYAGRVDRAEIETVPAAFGIKKRFSTREDIAERMDEELRYKRVRTVKPLDK